VDRTAFVFRISHSKLNLLGPEDGSSSVRRNVGDFTSLHGVMSHQTCVSLRITRYVDGSSFLGCRAALIDTYRRFEADIFSSYFDFGTTRLYMFVYKLYSLFLPL
jgi:hypothetical protein